jgi:hypothetical protein
MATKTDIGLGLFFTVLLFVLGLFLNDGFYLFLGFICLSATAGAQQNRYVNKKPSGRSTHRPGQ